jgi:hypothetical protein
MRRGERNIERGWTGVAGLVLALQFQIATDSFYKLQGHNFRDMNVVDFDRFRKYSSDAEQYSVSCSNFSVSRQKRLHTNFQRAFPPRESRNFPDWSTQGKSEKGNFPPDRGPCRSISPSPPPRPSRLQSARSAPSILAESQLLLWYLRIKVHNRWLG